MIRDLSKFNVKYEFKYEVPNSYKVDILPYMDYARYLAKQRHEQKKEFKTSNPLSDDYELVGILGEIVYQLQTEDIFDHRLLINGDDGSDFKGGVNVKSSLEYKAKHLIEYLDGEIPEIYVFVIINLDRYYGYIYSWISGEEFEKKHFITSFGWEDQKGNLNRKAMFLDDLNPYYTYQPLLNKIKSDYDAIRFISKKYGKINEK